MIEIKWIDNAHDSRQIARLRYAVYVEELGARMEYADHERKELREPSDETGRNLGAWVSGDLVGCVRINLGGESDLSEYEPLFGPKVRECLLPSIAVASKFAIHRPHRGGMLAIRILLAFYKQLQEEKSRLCYITCQPGLMPMYHKLGFRRCGPTSFHSEADALVPMVLVVQDFEYLRQVQSPYAEICAQYPIDQEQARALRPAYLCEQSISA